MEPYDQPCQACGVSAAPASHLIGFDRLHGEIPASARLSRLRGADRVHRRTGTFAVTICSACGSGTTRPRVAPADLAAFYPAAYGPYADADEPLTAVISRAVRAVQGRLALRRFPLTTVAARAPGHGLDVGCGRGDLAALLVGRGWSMAGVEPSPTACAAARSRGVDARTGTLATVELEPQAYDLVVFQHSLEHTAEPQRDLERVRLALAPGGIVVMTVPNFGCWQARRFRDLWYHLDLPRHRTHFTASGLTRLLERAGLRLERLATSSSSVGLPATLQYAVAGRCLFPGGLGLRVASGLCVPALPLARLADRIGGGGDQLHAVARARLQSRTSTPLISSSEPSARGLTTPRRDRLGDARGERAIDVVPVRRDRLR